MRPQKAKNKILISLLMIFFLTGCSNKGKVVEEPINNHSDQEIKENVSEEIEEEEPTEITKEEDLEEMTGIAEAQQYEWRPIEELSGKEVCGLVYTERPYKEIYYDFVGAPVDDRYYVIQDGDKFGLMNIDCEWVAKPVYAVVHYAYDYFLSLGYAWDDESYTLNNGNLTQLSENDYGFINGTSTDPTIEWNPETNSLITYYEQTKIMAPDNPSSWLYDDHYNYQGTFACSLYESNLNEDYKKAIITDNQPVTDFIYDDAMTFSDGLIAVKKDGNWGYIDANGDEIIPCEYTGIRTSECYYEYNIRNAGKNYPDSYPEEVVEAYIERWRSNFFPAACTDGYVVLSKDGQYALYSSTYEEVIPFGVYEDLSEVNHVKLFAKKEGVWGIVTLYDDPERENNVNAEEGVDEDELCKLAGDYYFKCIGTRPPLISIESWDGDIACIHLYERVDDGNGESHAATWDWYYVNIKTGETTNVMGESFNIFID